MSFNKVNNDGSLTVIAGGTLYADSPIGAILPYGGSAASIPAGWLLCNGTAISRTVYSDLFKVIGTSFGTGDGTTTFNLPGLQGEFLRGAGTNSHTNQGNGGTVGQHQDATEVQRLLVDYGKNLLVANNPGNDTPLVKNPDSSYAGLVSKTQYYTPSSEVDVVYNNQFTLRPTNTSVNYIIKAFHTSVPTDFMDAVEEAVEEGMTDVYSTSEVKTNKVWVDGKPIYRKVITGYTDDTLIEFSVPHNIANVEWVTSIGGGIFNDASAEGNDLIPFGFYNPSTNVTYYLSVLAGQITFRLRYCSLYCNKLYKIVLEYTKTTD